MVVNSCVEVEDLEGRMDIEENVEVGSTDGKKEERMSGGEQ